MIVYVENSKSLQQIIRKFIKMVRNRIDRQKLIAFLYASKIAANFNFKRIPLKMVQKIWYLGVNLTRIFKELHVEYYKNLLKYE